MSKSDKRQKSQRNEDPEQSVGSQDKSEFFEQMFPDYPTGSMKS